MTDYRYRVVFIAEPLIDPVATLIADNVDYADMCAAVRIFILDNFDDTGAVGIDRGLRAARDDCAIIRVNFGAIVIVA